MKNILKITCLIFLFFAFENCRHKTTEHTTTEPVIKTTEGKLDCITPTINIGEVANDTIIETKFTFINTGTENLKIIEYQVSCNCTSAFLKDSVISPKDTTVFSMKINTRGKYAGAHQTDAVIKTNGQRAFYKLTAKYIVR